jgi:hypothetical protein
MILPGETGAGTAGTQPCRGISRWAHRDDERGREDSFLRRPPPPRIERPHALKIPARRAEYSLRTSLLHFTLNQDSLRGKKKGPRRRAVLFALVLLGVRDGAGRA